MANGKRKRQSILTVREQLWPQMPHINRLPKVVTYSTMKLTINGEQREIDDGTSIAGLLDSKGLRAEMVVVEHNGQIVPRIEYASTTLAAGDNLEIVQMMAGG